MKSSEFSVSQTFCFSAVLVLVFILFTSVSRVSGGQDGTDAATAGWTRDERSQLCGTCRSCHEVIQDTACSMIDDPAAQGESPMAADCLDCHAVERAESLREITPPAAAEGHFPAHGSQCLACHPETGRETLQSVHTPARRVGCRDCHHLHQLRSDRMNAERGSLHAPETQLCGKCHLRVTSRFQLASSHNLNTGNLHCSSCHTPHQERIITISRVSASLFCGKCHPAQSASFYFHSRQHHEGVIGCLDCHDPHGSVNRHLLREPLTQLCRKCHR